VLLTDLEPFSRVTRYLSLQSLCALWGLLWSSTT